MINKLLENTILHKRLAENINKVMYPKDKQKKQEESRMINTILSNTEADPIFEELVFDIAGKFHFNIDSVFSRNKLIILIIFSS
jgi:hypothetical protein